MQQFPDIEKSDPKKTKQKISCLYGIKYNDRRKVCVNFITGTDNLRIVEL